jgi:hypothetical protein
MHALPREGAEVQNCSAQIAVFDIVVARHSTRKSSDERMIGRRDEKSSSAHQHLSLLKLPLSLLIVTCNDRRYEPSRTLFRLLSYIRWKRL